jgi:cardiolipin synthase
MTRTLIVVMLLMGLLPACAMKPVEPVPATTAITPTTPVTEGPVLLALQARQVNDQIHIQFLQDEQVFEATSTLPVFPGSAGSGTSTTLTLEEAVKRHEGMPIAPLLIQAADALSVPEGGMPLPIANITRWTDFRDRLCMEITPKETGKGVVIDFLRQEDLFFYFDDSGELQSVPVHEKPATIRIEATHSFEELLTMTAIQLGDYMTPAESVRSPALLFNTGDRTLYGFPFVYANAQTGQVAFLRRLPPEGEEFVRPSESAKSQAVMHATVSQVGSTVMQPVGSLTRLFGLVTHKTADTLTQKPVTLLKGKPIPPIANNPPMDAKQWEATLDELARSPTSQGQIKYLVDGEVFFARLIDTIQSAEESIDIRLYIFDNDDYAVKIADLLRRRSKEVEVRVLIDGLGTIGAASARSGSTPETYVPPASIVDYLQKDSDIEVQVLLNPWLAGDHSKTIVIDNRIGFLGGMNIGREYRYDWHDLMVELEGPVVDVLRDEFERSWKRGGLLGDVRAGLHKPITQVNLPNSNDIPIRVLYTKPGDSQILRTQLKAIGRAQQRIYIENAYFTSDAIIYELAKARRRGVDVNVIIPYQGDSDVINRSNILAANTMLANGIRVYIYPGTSHMKGAVYDGWLCLGSANFDDLSLRVNRELNIATSDPDAVQGFIDEVLQPDIDMSVELTEPFPKNWSDYLMELLADHL